MAEGLQGEALEEAVMGAVGEAEEALLAAAALAEAVVVGEDVTEAEG